MTTAAEAAKDFVSGPQVIEAARLLLERFPLAKLCEALGNARPDDEEALISALDRLSEFDEVRLSFVGDPALTIFLQQGASAQNARIRKLVVRLILRLSQDEAGVAQLVNAGLLVACEELLLDEDVGTAEAAAKTLGFASQLPAGRAVILGTDTECGIAQRLQERLRAVSDVERIRLLHLFVELGRASDVCFQVLEECGAYSEVLNSFLTDDILLKLNAVELMDALGSFRAGQQLLTRHDVPQKLAKELGDPMNDASVRVCVARLLGYVILYAPEQMKVLMPNKEAQYPQVWAEFLGSRDPAERLCALNAWANVSTHAEGLMFFIGWPQMMETLVSLVASHQEEICKGAMACWTSVLDAWPPSQSDAAPMDVDGSGVGASVSLWDTAGKQLLPSALKILAGKPFPEVRCHTWRLLAALSRSRPLAQRTLTSEQMRELLFDFASEQNSKARIAKHDFVSALLQYHGDWLLTFLDADTEKILTEYARQGPHWVPQVAAAAVADQNA